MVSKEIGSDLAAANVYFNRPGPRIVESLEILAACLHPALLEELRRKHSDSVVRLDADLEPTRSLESSCREDLGRRS
jgi:hypothetical protein